MEVEGLALAFGLSYTLTTVLAWQRLERDVGAMPRRRVASRLQRILVASALMAAAVAAVSWAIGGESNLHLLARVVAGVSVGVTVYVLVARALHIEEFTALLAVRPEPDMPEETRLASRRHR